MLPGHGRDSPNLLNNRWIHNNGPPPSKNWRILFSSRGLPAFRFNQKSTMD